MAGASIRPRLRLAGADLTKVGILDIREKIDGKWKPKRFALTDLSGLEDVIKATDGIRMVVIDPVASFGGKANGDKQFDVMSITSGLNELAARYSIAIVCCQHLNKSAAGGARGLRDRLMGSAGWYDGCRSCFLVTRDKDDDDRRVLSHGKTNHSKLQDAIGFAVVAGEAITLHWDDQTTDGYADDHLVETAATTEDVAVWLRDPTTFGSHQKRTRSR